MVVGAGFWKRSNRRGEIGEGLRRNFALWMGKKRKSVATSLDEVDRTMYATFCSAANSLSQLYTQTMNQQKLSFQAGERHGLVRLSLSGSVFFFFLSSIYHLSVPINFLFKKKVAFSIVILDEGCVFSCGY